MFYNTSAFNKDLANWKTVIVTNMEYMFYNSILFNGDIINWDVSKVENME